MPQDAYNNRLPDVSSGGPKLIFVIKLVKIIIVIPAVVEFIIAFLAYTVQIVPFQLLTALPAPSHVLHDFVDQYVVDFVGCCRLLPFNPLNIHFQIETAGKSIVQIQTLIVVLQILQRIARFLRLPYRLCIPIIGSDVLLPQAVRNLTFLIESYRRSSQHVFFRQIDVQFIQFLQQVDRACHVRFLVHVWHQIFGLKIDFFKHFTRYVE